MGYPVITVTEKEGGILVRQDRFLETGPADPKDNEAIWLVDVVIPSITILITSYAGLFL